MREISVDRIIEETARLCIQANKILPCDVTESIKSAQSKENFPLGNAILGDLLNNIDAAKKMDIPVCQDTGMAVVFIDIGQDVHIVGGELYEAVNMGVAKGYTEGYLRLSVVNDPLKRINTGNNTPAIIHTNILHGDNLKITVAPKGFGSENMSEIRMLTPASGREDIIENVLDIVKKAGSNSCPPMIIGVGIGGDFEYSAILAKRALCRPIDQPNSDEYYEQLEDDMLCAVNKLEIGPQGFSGNTTALKVNIEVFGTHIAGLPLAVNIGCHVTRHKSVNI